MSSARPFALFLLLLLPAAAFGQTYEEIRAWYPDGIETTVTSDYTFVYEQPVLSTTARGPAFSNIAGRYTRGKSVFAYRREGDFYAVATSERGHVGYILLTALDVPQVAGAATAPVVNREYRSPRAARLMSLAVPGAGHLYAGETVTGGVLLGLAAASLIGGYAYSARTEEYVCAEDNPLNCRFETDYNALIAGVAIYGGLAAYSFLTAGRAARRANERRGLAAHAAPVPVFTADAVRPGLAISVSW